MAAHDGRLQKLEGFGKKRLQGVSDSLAGMLNRSGRRRSKKAGSNEKSGKGEKEPPVELLLDVDKEYRRRAKADDLKKKRPQAFQSERQGLALHTLHAAPRVVVYRPLLQYRPRPRSGQNPGVGGHLL